MKLNTKWTSMLTALKEKEAKGKNNKAMRKVEKRVECYIKNYVINKLAYTKTVLKVTHDCSSFPYSVFALL